jgi:hypothetical protein
MAGGTSVAGAAPPQAAKTMLASTTSDIKMFRLRFTVLLLREWIDYRRMEIKSYL